MNASRNGPPRPLAGEGGGEGSPARASDGLPWGASGALLLGIALSMISVAQPRPVRAQTEARTGELTLALGGDVIFDAPVEYVLRARGLSADDPSSYDELFADLRGPLSRADLAIVNLETPVATRTRERSEERDYPTFAAPSAFLAALRSAGTDVVTVANNHAYDQGIRGLSETLAHARALGLHASGVADDRGYTITVAHGLRVATVSLTQGTNHRVEHDEPASPRVHFFDEDRLGRLVRDARADADVVVVALHFTDTGDHYPTRGMVRWGRRAAEAGADVVVGHGPHVPAALEWVETSGRRVPVFHSLGNLLAAMQAEEHAERSRGVHVRDAVLVGLRVRVERGRVSVSMPTAHAFWIDDARSGTGGAPFTRPVAIGDGASPALLARAGRLSSLLGGTGTGTGAETGAGTAGTGTGTATARTLVAMVPASLPPTATGTSTGSAPPSVLRVPTARTATRTETASTPEATATRAVSGVRESQAPSHGAGATLGVTFRCGSATETAVEERVITAWVARMRAEPRLRLEVIGERCDGEAASLGLRRARRAAGLIAIRGPSRSRFTHRAGAVGEAHVTAIVR